MNEDVKYHNDINKLNFNGLNDKELYKFYSIFFKAKEIHFKVV